MALKKKVRNNAAPVNDSANPAPAETAADPAPVKKTRKPRAPFHREIGDCVIDEVKGSVTMDGIAFPVRKFKITFGENDPRNSVRPTAREAIAYVNSFNPAKRSRKANPYGTLAIFRAIRALESIAARRDPDLCEALNAAIESLNADLTWQSENEIPVEEIKATEMDRIAKVQASRAAKNETNE